MSDIERLAQTPQFEGAKQALRAELIVWLLCKSPPRKAGVSVTDVCDAFSALNLARPNSTRIRENLRRSRNVRTVSKDCYGPLRKFDASVEKWFQLSQTVPDSTFDISGVAQPPFVSNERMEDLKRMVENYAYLFLLENSMRGLIESVLSKALGKNWWDMAANAKLKKKHEDRVRNETERKWAPTRSEFGPLYALDWPDLLTLMRKYPEHFCPVFHDMNFLHRYEDTGAFRNIVAHNGVLRDQEDFDRIRIYYRDWTKQLT